MRRLKLTSPGALLIFAIGLTGAILMVDAFFLRPYVTAQKDAALREQALKTERALRQAIGAEQKLLSNLNAICARSSKLEGMIRARGDDFQAFARGALEDSDVSVAWLTSPEGESLACWSRGDWLSADQAQLAKAKESIARVAHDPAPSGLLRFGERPVIFARQPVPAEADPKQAAGQLWLGRVMDSQITERIGQVIGADVVLVADDSLPPGALADGVTSHAMWETGDGILAVAWQAIDTKGANLGYFRADVPVAQIQAQANAARRMILITLSLSVGLVLLVITGTHILIAGPVVRLLTRLQQVDAGDKSSLSSLTHDLHGEPLVLARRLETAFNKLAHMSKTDQMTGMANRRHFQEVLECFYHQSRRYNRPLSLMVLDIDFFKAVNDTAGHQAGDEVLQIVSRAIESACRKADLPARLGGDEFSVLLPETLAADAERVAQRVLESVSAQPFTVKGIKFNLTVSIGVTDLNAGEIDSPETMISFADKALYAAKEMGRNRVVLAHDLNGVNLDNRDQQERRKVDVVCKKLAGLDTRFKDLFLQAVEEVVEVLEQRDSHMADHARKVQHFAVLIAREMGLPHRVIKRIRIAAMLHDIGMLAMPDTLLLCPGPLSPEQVQNMRRHPLLSVRIMEGMEFLEQEIPAVRYHHERFDGRGYPEGISGAAIPLTARILAVADCFDAITTERTYRPAKPREQALEEMKHMSGLQFDPVVVDAFLSVAGRLGESMMTVTNVDRQSLWREEGEDVEVQGSGLIIDATDITAT